MQETTFPSYCVYILFSEKDHILYIGFTTNLRNRIKKHNEGGVKSTAYRRPLKVIFMEFYLFKKDALAREKYFKKTSGKKAIKYMLNDTLLQLGYAAKMIEIVYEECDDVE
jgi:putative endonuclease